MQPFPDLTYNQVALIRADKRTGHILDENFSLALNDNQKVYTIFVSLNKAQIFAEEVLSSNNEIEIVIYSNKEDVLYYSNK